MSKKPYFVSWSCRAAVIGLSALLLCFVSRAPGTQAAGAPNTLSLSTPQLLVAIMRTVIAHGPEDFASLHAGAQSSDDDDIYFKLSATFKKVCPGCTVADEYTGANHPERYTVSGGWPLPVKWNATQTTAYILKYLAPLVPGYTLERGKNDDGELWFDWTKSSANSFLYVVTYHKTADNGFEIRFGHYLSKNVHYEPYVMLSAAQRDELTRAVRSFVTLGVQNASDNFTSLRGAATDKDNNFFDTSVSFGDFVHLCDVDGIYATDSTHPRWYFECETRDLGGPKSDIEALIQSAIAEALPGGFEVTTDPQYLGTYDYRWDRTSDHLAATLWNFANSDGTTDYHISIVRFGS
jgi:hypothetical protein